ncbi:hypothetical protein GCM10028808_18810 [Spirosoma migulaei]
MYEKRRRGPTVYYRIIRQRFQFNQFVISLKKNPQKGLAILIKTVPLQSFSVGNREDDKKLRLIMKKGIHPDYREVVFHDLSSDYKFLTRSTVQTRDSIEFEGKTYPLVKIEVSSQSHPFYTGKNVLLDTAGRVDKFRKRYGTKENATPTSQS